MSDLKAYRFDVTKKAKLELKCVRCKKPMSGGMIMNGKLVVWCEDHSLIEDHNTVLVYLTDKEAEKLKAMELFPDNVWTIKQVEN